jgi:hypothetical protein
MSAGVTIAGIPIMASESELSQAPLEQLLAELTDAKLEKREADIERIQKEIGRRQARGEQRPSREAAHAKTEF